VSGWVIPPPSQSVKNDEDLRREREAKVAELGRRGLLCSERLRRAMLIVRREDFIPSPYRDHAYEEVPLPLPGEWATISCSHSYPLFYEPPGLGEGHRFLEVGVGSGYGTSLAREVVGREGLVVTVDIDAATLAFARENLQRGLHRRGARSRRRGLGYPEHAPYDRICVTAACPDVPPPLMQQLAARGRLSAPVLEGRRQRLTFSRRPPTASGAGSSRTCCTCRCRDGTALAAMRTAESGPLSLVPVAHTLDQLVGVLLRS
jgi:protein-L-isoaspartate(D-aspartate) O-methyltransferase